MANFLSATANFEEFSTVLTSGINRHVLKNNDGILKKAFTFFQNDNKILLLNGFAGVGKKQIAEHLLSFLDKNTIVMRFVCTESTTLDDITLSFYQTLKKKTSLKDTSGLDAIEDMGDKVEYFLSRNDFKFVPVFYNFDWIKDQNRPNILNYVMSLSKKNNVKNLIIARTFDTDLIPEDIKYVKLMVKALSKELFETYIRDFGVKVTPAMLDQFYRLSRGYFFSACISCKIMVNQEFTVNDFIVQYTNSGMKFDEFLAKTYYRLIVGTTKSAFNLFVKLHHGLNLKILQTIGSYPEVILKTLSENFYIYRKGDLYYPTEFLKMQLEESIGDEISKKRLASYYEKQIALPPEERDFTISRESMQNEVAFYKGIELVKEEEQPEEKQEEQTPTEEVKDPEPEQKAPVYQNMSIPELVAAAEEHIKNYNYLIAVNVLTYILGKKDSITGSDVMYKTYDMLARTYSKLSKWKYALYYFELLENHYKNIDDKDNLHLMRFEKAFVYYKCYKIFESIKELKALLSVTKNSKIIAKCNLILGNIAISVGNFQMAIDHYKTAIANTDEDTEKAVKKELFFKYAILSDETNDIDTAIQYYQKCIEIKDSESKYSALAYSNLADLFYDNELLQEAKDCFEHAYEYDKLNNNEYGMYYSLSKLVELSDKKDKDKLIKMAEEAKEHALKTEDYNAIIDATIKLGDVYYDYPDPDKALSQYLELYRSDKEEFGEHNIKMVKSRLEDLRARFGKEKFEELVPDYE